MSKIPDKIKICLEVPGDLYRKLNLAILNKYGKIHGHIKESIAEGIELWLEKQ